MPIALSFWIAGGTLQLSVTATMPDDWTFTGSFTDLTLFPFDSLTVSDARFVYSTVEQPTFSWPGEEGTTIYLQPGQNLLCQLGLGGVSLVANLLGAVIGKDNSFRCSGPFAPTAGQHLPVGTLTASIDSSGFSIGTAPNALSLTEPRVAVRIGTADDDTNPVQEIDLLVLGTFQQVLEVAVSIPMAGDLYQVSTTPLPNESSITGLIKSLPGGAAAFTDYIPAELNPIFSSVGLDNFTMAVNTTPAVSYLGLSISTLHPWPLIPDVLVLDGLNLIIEVVDPSGLDWTSVQITAQAEFLPHIFTGEFDFTVGLEKQTSWEVSGVSGSYYSAVSLGDIVGGLLGNQDSVPTALRAIEFSEFGVSATRNAPASPLHLQPLRQRRGCLPDSRRRADRTPGPGRHEDRNKLRDPPQRCPRRRQRGLHHHARSGHERVSPECYVDRYRNVARLWRHRRRVWLGGRAADPPGAGPGPRVGDAQLRLHQRGPRAGGTVGELRQGGARRAEGRGLVVLLRARDRPCYRAQRHPDHRPSPAGGVSVSVDQIQVLGPPALDQAAATLVDGELSKLGCRAIPSYPRRACPAWPSRWYSTRAGRTRRWPSPRRRRPGPGPRRLPHSASPPGPSDGTVWVTLQKSFGPVAFQKVGIRYRDSILYFLMGRGPGARPGGLTIAMTGLGVGSPLATFEPTFTIDGLAITYADGPVVLSGALAGTIDPVELLRRADPADRGAADRGALRLLRGRGPAVVVRLRGARLPDRRSRVLLRHRTGGRLFGFNRNLVIPPVGQVGTFPLVQWAQGARAARRRWTPARSAPRWPT